MNTNRLSFVLPLKIDTYGKGSDLDRVRKILMPSLMKYFKVEQISKFFVMVPSSDLEEVSRQLASFVVPLKLRILTEESVLEKIPGWTKHRWIHQLLRYPIRADVQLNKGEVIRPFRCSRRLAEYEGMVETTIVEIVRGKTSGYLLLYDPRFGSLPDATCGLFPVISRRPGDPLHVSRRRAL